MTAEVSLAMAGTSIERAMVSLRSRARPKMAAPALAGVLVLCGCSGPPAPPGDDYREMETALTACQDTQRTVVDALQGTDLAAARTALGAAESACRQAAAQVRTHPLPGTDAEAMAQGIDQMASGLGEIGDAIPIIGHSPARARAKVQSGMKAYEKGLTTMKAGMRSSK